MEHDYKNLWLRILTELSLQIARPFFITYFKDSAVLGFSDEGTLIIGVPRPMFLSWHLEHTQDKIRVIAMRIDPKISQIVLQVEGSLEGDSERTIDLIKHFPDKTKGRKIPNRQEVRLADGITSKILNPKYQLSNFIIGNNNEMAYAASRAVSGAPGTKYNPLFIYGGVGLGKTHLLQAIGNEIIKNDPQKLVVYVTSETFTNEVVESMQKRSMEKFRKRYRAIDVLIIDDIQFFAGKDRTQEEFFHTFNTLHEDSKQVIISSDRPPKELDGLEDRLKSRCEWGMTVDVKMPDFETRLAILYEKSRLYQALISPDVLEFIAFNVHHSIRELEGILMQVVAIIELKKETPTIEMVAEIIRRLNKDIKLQGFLENTPAVSKDIDSLVLCVADYYNLTVSDLIGQKRSREMMLPRQMAMYLAKQYLSLSLQKIGDFFEGRDHTSVLHAVKKISDEKKKPGVVSQDIKKLQKIIGV
jgi:chromosomal replication initiator protein